MSRLEANISLLIITFFAAAQYVFLAGVPENVSHFAFLCITNLVGLLITLAFFFGELFRLDKQQVFQSIVLSAELVVFNLFTLLGVRGINTTTSAAIVSAYFVFIVIFSVVFLKQTPSLGTMSGVIAVLAGLFLMTDADIHGLMNANVLYLLIADAFFALYIMTVGTYAKSSNSSILAMGSLFFCFVFSLILCGCDALFFGADFSVPSEPAFWGGVIYMSFFIRGLYGIVQLYAQRYVTPLNTSLIFSTALIMTMAISPLMTKFFGAPPKTITPLRIAGAVIIVIGILLAEPEVFDAIRKAVRESSESRSFFVSSAVRNFLNACQHFRVIAVSAAAYFLMGIPAAEILREFLYIAVTGLGMWYGWHIFADSPRIQFRRIAHFVTYILLVLVLSMACFDMKVSAAYFIMGVLICLPVNILFGSILGVEPVLPNGEIPQDDACFVIDSEPELLEAANKTIELAGETAGVNTNQVMRIQSCIEELSIRILKAIPHAKINVSVKFGYAVSVKISCKGAKYNPFRIKKDEDMLDSMNLSIIKHRALRASYSYRDGTNLVHVIV